jgi:hypothetical protein
VRAIFEAFSSQHQLRSDKGKQLADLSETFTTRSSLYLTFFNVQILSLGMINSARGNTLHTKQKHAHKEYDSSTVAHAAYSTYEASTATYRRTGAPLIDTLMFRLRRNYCFQLPNTSHLSDFLPRFGRVGPSFPPFLLITLLIAVHNKQRSWVINIWFSLLKEKHRRSQLLRRSV